MPLPPRQKVPKVRPAKEGTVITDDRFANFQVDPRFRLPSKKHAKTKIDERFKRVFKDEDFAQKASVDRYGRKIEKGAGKKQLERFYRMDEESSESEEKGEDDKVVVKELKKANKQDKKYDPIREGGFSDSSSEEESSSDEEEEVEEIQEAELAEEKEQVPMGELSARLAAVNMDWDNMRAMDLMAVASSFAPTEGRILSVTIYPSEFGRERMDREEIEGPPREIFSVSKAQEASPDPEEGPSESESESEVDEEQIKKELLEGDSNTQDFDSTALRKYQLDRLRYFYAVIVCSSPTVAKALYDNMDGREYLSSANFFDLRFVPDEVDFDERPHDTCDKLPDAYKPNEFTTDALNHSRVKLTWDADDRTRKEVQKRAFSQKEIEENDLQAYLGSDTSSEDEEEVPERGKQKTDKAAALREKLGLGGDEPRASKAGLKRDRDHKKPEGDMQITFSAGISASAPTGSVFENEPEETTVEKYVRKERERKARRKERAKLVKQGLDPDTADASATTEPQAQEADEDAGFNDPFFDASPEPESKPKKQTKAERLAKRATREKEEQSTAAERAHLELLMLDDEKSHVRHFDMNEVLKAEKAKKNRKKGKRKGEGDVEARQDGFKMDVSDPRFERLYQSHEFAIDPTNPRFKGTVGMKALLEEGRRKRRVGDDGEGGDGEGRREKRVKRDDATSGAGDKEDLKKLAARVKARAGKA